MRNYKPDGYGLTRHRYTELSSFCLQYDDFVRRAGADPAALHNRELIDAAIADACGPDAGLRDYLRNAVRWGLAYEKLGQVPCGRAQFYTLRRRFFWILDRIRK